MGADLPVLSQHIRTSWRFFLIGGYWCRVVCSVEPMIEADAAAI